MAQGDAGDFAKIAIFDVKIGVTDPTTLHLECRFAIFQWAKLLFLNIYTVVFSDYGSFHRMSLLR
ncbi:hypothetical protein D3C81_1282480 [compost metagenome]